MAWIDLKAVKQSVSMDDLLSRYGVSLKKVNSVQLRGCCPLPTHTSKDSRWSFNVNTERNIWSCKSDSCVSGSGRKGGNCLDFVAAMEKCSVVDAAKKIVEWYGRKPEQQNSPLKAESPAHEGNAQPHLTTVVEGNKPLAWELKGIAYHEYLSGRGISEEMALKFGVGFFPGKGSMAGRIVIPIRNEKGELVAYAGRALNGDEPKYKLPPGFHKSLVLWNRYALSGDACTIVEGYFGAIKVAEAGFPVVALMGRTLSEAQERLLRFKYITLMLDPDEPGKAATQELILRISRNHYVRMARHDKPPDEMTAEEIKNALRYVCPI